MAATWLDGEVTHVGLVPDEVLLCCGRPDGTPSAWWTPWLAARAPAEVARRRRDAVAVLHDRGLRAPDGTLRGPLGDVADVVARCALAVLLERDGPGGPHRCSLLAAPDRVLVDEQRRDVGAHQLSLASPRAAVALLVGLLDPHGRAHGPTGRARVRSPSEVVRLLPPGRRAATTRVTATRRPRAVAHAVTVVDDGTDLWCVHAGRAGRCTVRRAGEGDVVDLAIGLLGAEPGEGAGVGVGA